MQGKGISPIAESLKKLAACPVKTKKTPLPNKLPVASSSTSTESKQHSKSSSEATSGDTTSPENTAKVTTKSANAAENESCNEQKVAISEENLARLHHFAVLREKYVSRAIELATRPDSEDFEEESLCLKDADLPAVEKGSVEVGEEGDFPDCLVPYLLVIVQGRWAL